MFVRELTDGQEIDQVLLVRAQELRTKRDGSEYLRLSLADRTGAVVAVMHDAERELAAACESGACVRVSGRYELHPRHGAQLDRVLGPEAPTWPSFRDAPAAKRYHQAYRHGLLEHSLGVAQAVAVISTTFPGIDRDVAITGALLHDIGKLDAYTADPLAIDLTDLGKLHGEISLGYYRIRREIEDIHGFPPELAAAVLHIILSHHGQLEHGSPVVPATREATLVHMIDNLGGRLGSFDRLEKELPHGSVWSGYDRALGGGAYFAARQAA
jgi:3'-5' exoribonuclease